MRRLPTEGWILLCVIVVAALLPRAVPDESARDVGRLTIGGLAPGASRDDVRRLWRIHDVPVLGDVVLGDEHVVATLERGKVVTVVGPELERDGRGFLPCIHGGMTCASDVCDVLGSCDRHEGGGMFSTEPRIMVFTRYDLRVKYNLKHMVMEYRLGTPPQ